MAEWNDERDERDEPDLRWTCPHGVEDGWGCGPCEEARDARFLEESVEESAK